MTSELFAADYEALDDLAWDGPCEMLRGRHRASGKTVTIYVLRQGAPESSARQFRRQQRIRSKLTHANILAARHGGERAGRAFIVEEYAGDTTLRALLEAPLAPGRALALVAQISHGLEHAHDAGIVHGDLQPENIVVAVGDIVKIGGWSRAIDTGRSDAADPVVIGAIDFLSPEQLRGAAAEPATDIYALGVVLFLALAGAPPFGPGDFGEIARAHELEAPPSLAERRPGTPDAIVALVGDMLAKGPATRPSAGQVAQRCADAARASWGVPKR